MSFMKFEFCSAVFVITICQLPFFSEEYLELLRSSRRVSNSDRLLLSEVVILPPPNVPEYGG